MLTARARQRTGDISRAHPFASVARQQMRSSAPHFAACARPLAFNALSCPTLQAIARHFQSVSPWRAK